MAIINQLNIENRMHKTHQLFVMVMHRIRIKKSTIEQLIYLKSPSTFESIEIIWNFCKGIYREKL